MMFPVPSVGGTREFICRVTRMRSHIIRIRDGQVVRVVAGFHPLEQKYRRGIVAGLDLPDKCLFRPLCREIDLCRYLLCLPCPGILYPDREIERGILGEPRGVGIDRDKTEFCLPLHHHIDTGGLGLGYAVYCTIADTDRNSHETGICLFIGQQYQVYGFLFACIYRAKMVEVGVFRGYRGTHIFNGYGNIVCKCLPGIR